MLRFVFFSFISLITFTDCFAQGSQIKIDTTESFLYLIDLSKKVIHLDGTYSFPFDETIQISSSEPLSKKQLHLQIKSKIIDRKLRSDSVFIDCDLLILDYIKRNDSHNYQILAPIKNSCAAIKNASNTIINHRKKFNGIEYSYTIQCVEGNWIRIESDLDFFSLILGQSINLFNANASHSSLFVLLEQRRAYFL